MTSTAEARELIRCKREVNVRKSAVSFAVAYSFSLCYFATDLPASTACDDGLPTERNFQQIAIGMSKNDLIRLIGEPKDYRKGPTQFPAARFFPGIIEASVWKSDQVRIMVLFDSQNRVVWKLLDFAEPAEPSPASSVDPALSDSAYWRASVICPQRSTRQRCGIFRRR